MPKKEKKLTVITLLIKLSCFTIPVLQVRFHKFPQNEATSVTSTLPNTLYLEYKTQSGNVFKREPHLELN